MADMSKPFDFSQEYLKNILHYNKITGIFTWKDRPGESRFNKSLIGVKAGTTGVDGYIYINIRGRKCKAHRLAWFYVHGEQPPEIDHEDKIRYHNWLSNLRKANHNQNQRNKSAYSNNVSGFKGVSKNGNRWLAQINVNGKPIHIGRFDTPEEASEAYIKAAKKYHKNFARWDMEIAKAKFRPMLPPMRKYNLRQGV